MGKATVLDIDDAALVLSSNPAGMFKSDLNSPSCTMLLWSDKTLLVAYSGHGKTALFRPCQERHHGSHKTVCQTYTQIRATSLHLYGISFITPPEHRAKPLLLPRASATSLAAHPSTRDTNPRITISLIPVAK